MEFFQNIWNGVVQYAPQILSSITIAEVVALVFMIIKNFTQGKSIKQMLSSSNTLSLALKENGKLSERVTEIQSSVTRQDEKIGEVLDYADKLLIKLDATLDVLSIVYSTLKDEERRVAIGNIIVNAKYADTATRASLVKKLEELKKENAATLIKTEQAVNEIEKTLTVDTKPATVRG